ncbi:MAG: hypothetical protein IKP27_05770 [Paludibacteraceae bacterium]|nr:hypothetical protein [Paludibacteraceae bacterium]
MKEELVFEKTASEWQGTDKYPGIDTYEKVVLKAGTELCALVSYKNGEMCPCEYLFPKNALEIAKDDDVLLNRMLQIAPWKKTGTEECSYRNEIAMFTLKRDLEVETGKTSENTAYGMGGMTQYYIPEQKFITLFNDKENGLERTLFENGSSSKILNNNTIDIDDYERMMKQEAQLQMRRNLFCTQRAKLDTLDIIRNSPKQEDVELAEKNLKKLDADIRSIRRNIEKSKKEIGKVPSPLYDDLNRRLAAEIKCRESGENVLVLGNVKTEISSKKTADNVLERANLNVVTVVDVDKAESVAQNLFKKIDGYDESKPRNDIDVKGQDLVDVMNINRINKECQKVMAAQELQPRNFQVLERIALPTTDGKQKEYRLDELFTEAAVQKIRSAQNGKLTEPLTMKDGHTAKLLMMGDKANLFLAQPKESLNATLDKMGLDDTERKRLLSGETIVYKQSHAKLDKDLNCIVSGAAGRLSPPAKTQAKAQEKNQSQAQGPSTPKPRSIPKKRGHSL